MKKKEESLEDIYNNYMNENKSESEAELIGEEKDTYEALENDSLELEEDDNYKPLNTDSLEVENFEPASEDNEEELKKGIFSDESFQEVEKIVKTKEKEELESNLKEGIFETEDYKEVEKIIQEKEKKEESSKDKSIVIAIILILLLFLVAIILFFLFRNKEDKNKKNSSGQSSTVKELPYQEIMNKYGDKVTEQIELYYVSNQSLPKELPEVEIEGYTITCEIKEIYNQKEIYLDNCRINESENIYSYGEKKIVEDTNTNTTSNLNTMSNSNSTSNKPSNTNTNKPSNTNKPTNSNKPSNSNTNKPSNTNVNTVTSGAISNSGNKSQHTPNKFGTFSKVVEIKQEELTTYTCTYEDCYSGNDGKIAYASDGSMVFNEKNPIVSYKIPSNSKISEQYSINITVKGDTVNQVDKYGGAILGISKTDANYLAWLGYKNGELIIYTFSGQTESDGGFINIPFSPYNNKVVNIQIVAKRANDTIVYINGVKKKTFKSGIEKLPFSFITLGDLRPGRGLKFSGNIYEAVVYDRLLSEKEVKNNYEAAKRNYNIK